VRGLCLVCFDAFSTTGECCSTLLGSKAAGCGLLGRCSSEVLSVCKKPHARLATIGWFLGVHMLAFNAVVLFGLYLSAACHMLRWHNGCWGISVWGMLSSACTFTMPALSRFYIVYTSFTLSGTFELPALHLCAVLLLMPWFAVCILRATALWRC
jgi:hypothetical protein